MIPQIRKNPHISTRINPRGPALPPSNSSGHKGPTIIANTTYMTILIVNI